MTYVRGHRCSQESREVRLPGLGYFYMQEHTEDDIYDCPGLDVGTMKTSEPQQYWYFKNPNIDDTTFTNWVYSDKLHTQHTRWCSYHVSVFFGVQFHIDMEFTIFSLLPEFNRLEKKNKMWAGYLDVFKI